MISLLCLVDEDMIIKIFYLFLLLVPTPPNEPLLTKSKPINRTYSGMALTYTCTFKIDPYNDSDAKPVTVWKKDNVELTSDHRLTMIPPRLVSGFIDTYHADLEFDYLTLDDEGRYTCVAFVNSSVNNEFIRKGNSPTILSAISYLFVEGTLKILSNHNFIFRYMYM